MEIDQIMMKLVLLTVFLQARSPIPAADYGRYGKTSDLKYTMDHHAKYIRACESV